MKKTKLTFWLIGFGCGIMVTSMVNVLITLNLTPTDVQQSIKNDILAPTTQTITETISNEKTDMPTNIKIENIDEQLHKDTTSVEEINTTIENQTEPTNTSVEQTEDMTKTTEKAEQTTQTSKTCQITITDYLSGNDICKMLAEKGLVDDADAFRKYIWEQGKAKALNSGTIDIPYGLSYAELLTLLTT